MSRKKYTKIVRKVKQGESVRTIARDHGYWFFSWHKGVWKHDLNAKLRDKGRKPDILDPHGDEVVIPPGFRTNERHTLDLGLGNMLVRLLIKDINGEPLAKKPWRLKGTATLTTKDDKPFKVTRKGYTSSKGRIMTFVPQSLREATLRVSLYTFELRINYLNPIEQTGDKGVSGHQARLRNLGYDIVVDGDWGKGSKAVLKRFQTDVNALKNPTKKGPKKKLETKGSLKDATTWHWLEREHGC